MSAIWYHNKKQKKAIQKGKKAFQKVLDSKGKGKIASAIEPAKHFTLAEDYHQKFYLRKHNVLLVALDCKDDMELINSHVATRLNGYVAGQGNPEQLASEIESFGLSKEAQEYLTQLVRSKKRGFFCSG